MCVFCCVRSVAVDVMPGAQEPTPPVPSGGDDDAFSSFGGALDLNPLRSLLESHPPFSVSLDLAPPEDPPENDFEDSLRTRHAQLSDSSSSPV